MNLPLKDICVVELGTSVAAPYGTWILGTLGAQVYKVERHGTGDDARSWGIDHHAGKSLWFQVLNSGKKSFAVDLKDDAQRETLRAFILRRADVVVQNFRPGRAQNLGLDGESLTAEKPDLVYCNIGAFGDDGPLKARPGYDPLMQAFGGIMSVTGEQGRPPVRVGSSIIDMGTGMWAAIGILAALKRREQTGRGGIVDTALFETALGWMTLPGTDYLMTGKVPGRHGSGVAAIAPYQAYECNDGYLVIGGGNDRLFAKICEVLGHSEWALDPRFITNEMRIQNRSALNEALSATLITQGRTYWQTRFDAAGVPSAPTQTLDEVFAHEQVHANHMMTTLDDGELKLVSMPLKIDGERPKFTRAAPGIGEHNPDLLKDG